MKPNRRLKLVPPEPAPEIHIDAQWREDARQRDWGAVHIAGDRSPPVFLSFLRWVHRL